MSSTTPNVLCSLTKAAENLNYHGRLCKWFMSQSSFGVSLMSSCFSPLPMIYIWMRDKTLDTWYMDQCVSKANIIMNRMPVYVCGPRVDCLWRCPKSNTPFSRINRHPFSIPRSPEMKRSFFNNYHLRQSIAGELDPSRHHPAPLRSHQAWVWSRPSPAEIALNVRKMYIIEATDQNDRGPIRIQTATPPPPAFPL